MQLRVLFLGNHTVGVQVLNVLFHYNCLVGVVSHPFDPEDGVNYLSVYNHAQENLKVPVLRSTPKSSDFLNFINALKPDLLWVTDYKYLLPEAAYCKVKYGAINLHPSLLPKYRGRAPLNWAIINGENVVGLTAHFIDKGMDTGDVIKQILLPIEDSDYIGDVLNKLYPIYTRITSEIIGSLISGGKISGYKQDDTLQSTYGARKPEDGLIDCKKEIKKIINFIKALSKPYPGAYLCLEEQKIIIWSAKESLRHYPEIGLHKENGKFYVQCASGGALEVTSYEIQ